METAKATREREQLERLKAEMIGRYMGLQDKADGLNEAIYKLCCDIEMLNQRIERVREAEVEEQARLVVKVAMKPGSNGNGNGNGHNGNGAHK